MTRIELPELSTHQRPFAFMVENPELDPLAFIIQQLRQQFAQMNIPEGKRPNISVADIALTGLHIAAPLMQTFPKWIKTATSFSEIAALPDTENSFDITLCRGMLTRESERKRGDAVRALSDATKADGLVMIQDFVCDDEDRCDEIAELFNAMRSMLGKKKEIEIPTVDQVASLLGEYDFEVIDRRVSPVRVPLLSYLAANGHVVDDRGLAQLIDCCESATTFKMITGVGEVSVELPIATIAALNEKPLSPKKTKKK